jgi:hypothetical protein
MYGLNVLSWHLPGGTERNHSIRMQCNNAPTYKLEGHLTRTLHINENIEKEMLHIIQIIMEQNYFHFKKQYCKTN